MKKLCHISTTKKYIDWFEDDWNKVGQFLEKHNLDGVELGLTIDYPLENIAKEMVGGVHLSFFPMWLEFWNEDKELVSTLVGDDNEVEQYYGGIDKNVIVETYKKQHMRARELGAKYMVFHVCHIRPHDSFTWKFDYTNKQVIEAAINIINEAFEYEEGDPMLLFENLWWPGLTLLDKAECELLLEKVNYKDKGFVLDVSHLILTDTTIDSEQRAYEHIKQVVENLGEVREFIKVVHLNKTLPKYYMRQNQQFKLEKFEKETDKIKKHRLLMDHVNKLDPHQPFDHQIAKEILELIKPLYCVYETNPQTINELNYFMKLQNKALN
ncbi:MAG: xylose isomerase [Epulopiscium sp. Nele67-Bin004]|nr:MAG: xylose isomerase [Epulopiscium sp. Nele67-Bin004]